MIYCLIIKERIKGTPQYVVGGLENPNNPDIIAKGKYIANIQT